MKRVKLQGFPSPYVDPLKVYFIYISIVLIGN